MIRSWLATVAIVAACGGGGAAVAPPAPCPTPAVAAPAPPPVAKPVVDGVWNGALGGKLRVEVTFHDGGGKLASLDQGTHLELDHVSLGDTVHFEIAAIQGVYDGKLEGDRITGTWHQGTSPVMHLDLARGPAPASTEPPAPKRPPDALDLQPDIVAPTAPAVLRAGDKTHLVYELHVTSFAHTFELARIDVTGDGKPLATFDATALATMIQGGSRTVPSGLRVVVFVWITLPGATVPKQLEHRVVVATRGGEVQLPGPTVAVAAAPRAIAPPLHGTRWLAGNGPANTSSHRRALMAIGGRAHIGQRFAIDWVELGADGKTFTGDASKNASYHAYGQQALAVADATITAVVDGIPENVPHEDKRAVPITLDTIGGNHVIADLGGGRFAFWAHLQPGSIRVKVGDRVKRGQVLGLVGNSGNSSEPHLHFHVMDAGSHLGAEGVPYTMDFALVPADGGKSVAKTGQMPADNQLVDL